MFCVPKYSNPDGTTYSDETVRRIAALKPAAKDFRIIWDNAYIVHDLRETPDQAAQHFPRVREKLYRGYAYRGRLNLEGYFQRRRHSRTCRFDKNVAMIKDRMKMQTIGYDKINQLQPCKIPEEYGRSQSTYEKARRNNRAEV